MKPYLYSHIRLYGKHRDFFTFTLLCILYQLIGCVQVCFVWYLTLDNFIIFLLILHKKLYIFMREQKKKTVINEDISCSCCLLVPSVLLCNFMRVYVVISLPYYWSCHCLKIVSFSLCYYFLLYTVYMFWNLVSIFQYHQCNKRKLYSPGNYNVVPYLWAVWITLILQNIW